MFLTRCHHPARNRRATHGGGGCNRGKKILLVGHRVEKSGKAEKIESETTLREKVPKMAMRN